MGDPLLILFDLNDRSKWQIQMPDPDIRSVSDLTQVYVSKMGSFKKTARVGAVFLFILSLNTTVHNSIARIFRGVQLFI